MKRIHNGMVYDTDKAERIASYKYGDLNDAKYVIEELYKTKNDRYFLYAQGGALSEYGEKVGTNSYSGNSVILPLSVDEVFDWAEDRNINSQKLVEELSDYLDEA
ncbi:hypothetical protein [Natranaerobius thermophilus]|uniref:Uncharacterized protein n=1 Tax=Natranaerobius thermophilus (strain ATCC BAA-1301 / DSM 18059 / JW/NM-WN-LF) TaxID=457570 RepID=B2A5E6_NATTJ|nr:hypothetical protein [Natranaerobius thermophilus]ACB83980.1 hypothetical protein Nther_0384 [Natranaerobius thermophilus JW/NM-WN-LF]